MLPTLSFLSCCSRAANFSESSHSSQMSR